jgi:type I restriction enzyme S subunit
VSKIVFNRRFYGYFAKVYFVGIINCGSLGYNCKINTLTLENQRQSSYLTKLRQAILQEAIEGKLTADWRKENPVRKGDPDYDAEALLEKIKGEKQKLIAEGKIKKQNPIAPIKPEEVPFELPEGWVWTRLGEVSYKITDGTHFTPHYTKTGVQFVSAKDIKSGELIFNNCKFISKEQHEKLFERCNPEEFDIIISKSGSIGTVVLNKYKHHFSFFESLALVKYFSELIIPSYMQLCVQFSCNNLKREDIRGVAVKHLHLEVLRTLLTAIPPITEQQVIADRVEKFLSMVDELEKQVSERKEQSEQLMQVVLREAFEGGK